MVVDGGALLPPPDEPCDDPEPDDDPELEFVEPDPLEVIVAGW